MKKTHKNLKKIHQKFKKIGGIDTKQFRTHRNNVNCIKKNIIGEFTINYFPTKSTRIVVFKNFV